MEALIAEAERRGLWKLGSRIFPENEWRDVVIVERLLGPAAA